MKSKIKVYRSKPSNLSLNDEYMFKHEYFKVFEKFHIRNLYNVSVLNGEFFYKGIFRYKSKYWKMSQYSLLQKFKQFIKDLLASLMSSNKNVEVVNLGIWVINEKSSKYFHWIGDVLPRIEGFVSQNKDIKISEIPIVLTKEYKNYEYVKKIISSYGLNVLYLEKDIKYKFKKLIVTSHAAPSGNYDEDLIKEQSKRLKNIYVKNKNESKNKVWISRQSADKRKIENFSEIKLILEKYDFQIYSFEDKSLNEQFEIVNNAEVLGGIHGAGLINMILLDQRKKVIEIRGRGDTHNNCFYSLSSALDLEYNYFLAEVPDSNYYGANYTLDINKFEIFLKKVLIG